MEGAARYPLEILPKEMWEKIILEVKDSEDLRSIMKASTQLSAIFNDIRHFWLLDKVLPNLLPTTEEESSHYLDTEDLHNLRLVDKRWSRAVNAFLENQPDLRPYNKEDDKINSEAHIWSDKGSMYNYTSDYATWDRWNIIGTAKFADDDIDGFCDQFKNPQKSPFLSRSVVGCTRSDFDLPLFGEELVRYYPGPVGEGKEAFWEEMVHNVFKKFGKHIWFLTMVWDEDGLYWEPGPMWKSIVNSLSSLPNLKGLHLDITEIQYSMCSSEAKRFLQLEENQLPSLPHLESLKIVQHDYCEFPVLMFPQLVSKYCLQLRRLHVHIKWGNLDEKVWPNLTFPNLIELYLGEIGGSEFVSLWDILESLEAPQLTKLELASCATYEIDMEEDVFPLIAQFPSLLHLDISCVDFVISECGALEPSQDSKPSLKYLKIHNSHGVNYNFLRCLPNLERLQIRVKRAEPIVYDCSVYPEITIKLETETCSLYESNVWDLCPKLKTISLLFRSNYYDDYYGFDRTTFEKLKNSPDPARAGGDDEDESEVESFVSARSGSD